MTRSAAQVPAESGATLPSTLLCAIGADYRFRSLSPAWQSLLGLSPDDLRAKPFLEWLHPDDRPAALEEMGRLRDNLDAVSFDARVSSKEGHYRAFAWSAFAADRDLVHAVGRTLAEPSGTSPEFRVRLSESPDGIVVLSGDRRIAIISTETSAVRRLLQADVSGPSVEILLPRSRDLSGVSRGNPLELSLGALKRPEPPRASAPAAPSWPTLAENTNDAILVRTPDDLVIHWNPAAEKLYGYPPREILGHPAASLVPPERSGEDRRLHARVFQGERLPAYETERLRKDGTPVEVSVSTLLLLEGPRVVGFAEIARDISERKREERRLARRAEDLARSNADLQDFASTLSHDLQEPLHAVITYLRAFQSRFTERADDDRAELLAFALDSAQWMQTLTRDLLGYARLDIPEKEFALINPNDLVERALTVLRPRMEESEARVLRGPLPDVRAHRTRLAQVFHNLIANALKYRGSNPPVVRIEAERRPGEVLFRVSDNGIGIEPERLRQIFRPSLRRHEEEAQPGLGMGLAIASKVVERHGGRIWVESTPGRGSTFFFTLPEREERGTS